MKNYREKRNTALKVILAIFVTFASYTVARHATASERDYNDAWCEGKGESEIVLSDKTRVDCLTGKYAVETDFSYKWAEAVGQSLHYALMTDKKPAILLIINDRSSPHVKRLQSVIENTCPKITVFYVVEDKI